jgi:hypothetical protein
MGQEQRKNERFGVQHEVRVRRGEVELQGFTLNLSLGGASLRLELDGPLQVGERFEISFRLPDLDAPLRSQASVRWVSEIDPGLCGVQFMTGFRAKETWAFNRFLERARLRHSDAV